MDRCSILTDNHCSISLVDIDECRLNLKEIDIEIMRLKKRRAELRKKDRSFYTIMFYLILLGVLLIIRSFL